MKLHTRNVSSLIACTLLVTGCGSDNSPSPVDSPGRQTSTKTDVLEAGAAMLQSKEPLQALNAYLDGFHFYSGAMDQQMEAHHYCSLLNEDVIQCVIYDGNTSDAKIMGVEYIVSAEVFATLPTEEKHLWHSHHHEVRSGQLIAPGIPALAEKELMEKLVGTYGKTWHTWHTDQNLELPLGHPMLMMGATADGQINEQLVAARDERFGVSTQEKRENRADLPTPEVDPEANAWQKGITLQLQTVRVGENAPVHTGHN